MLYLHPFYQPGAQITLNLRSCNSDDDKATRNAQATVVKALTPFTMSQVLLVDINPPSPDIIPAVNSSFILKVYDPRFLQHRKGSTSSRPHPWTLDAETTAARRRSFSEDKHVFVPTWWPDDSDAAGWEEYYHANLTQMFKTELAAYARLRPLQGRCVPHCYAHGTLAFPPHSKRMIVPRVLLLSYIPGPSLRSVQASRVSPMLAHGLIGTIRDFGALGVIHDDLRAENVVLYKTKSHIAGAFVLDFGNATVRSDEGDEQWEWIVAENDEPKQVEMILDRLGIDYAL
ncbi:hypothetical protein R3P38DRAFT_2828653 [Favolaschia claudopus]|uniref:Non-specific serine/threonine protein kinase n=1 Tax=Favolaschia claudopus TaxID=2862362 RepID=A0AAW0E9Q0_9AGAR